MGDDVATMIEWFHERMKSEVIEVDSRAWWGLLDDLSPGDHARLAQWYDEMHAA